MKASGTYGWLGVQAFFVITGFVVPMSLAKGKGSFLARRLLRLYPPFALTALATILLHYLSSMIPGFVGQDPDFSLVQLISNATFTARHLGQPWIIPVFWTLAIEFQFYMVAMLLFTPRLLNMKYGWHAVLASMLALAWIPVDKAWLAPYLAYFAIGSAGYALSSGRISLRMFAATLTAFSFTGWAIYGPVEATIAMTTALIILAWKQNPPSWLLWLGSISYSLYLVHVPIGGRVINLGKRVADSGASELVVCFVALFVSLIAAWIMWRFVELPSIAWSKKWAKGHTSAMKTFSNPREQHET